MCPGASERRGAEVARAPRRRPPAAQTIRVGPAVDWGVGRFVLRVPAEGVAGGAAGRRQALGTQPPAAIHRRVSVAQQKNLPMCCLRVVGRMSRGLVGDLKPKMMDQSCFQPNAFLSHRSGSILKEMVGRSKASGGKASVAWLGSRASVTAGLGKSMEHLACFVSRHDIAAIWVAFFSRCQRYRC